MADVPTKTPYELERDARIARNNAFIAKVELKEARDTLFPQPTKAPRKPPQRKPLPPPRTKSTRAASLQAQRAVTAIVNFENSAEPSLRQPKQPLKMVKTSEGPMIETVKDFLLAHCGYVECDADNPEALNKTLAMVSQSFVGLKDILAITDREPDSIIAQLKCIMPDAMPVEITRMARGLGRLRGADPSRSSGSEDVTSGGSTETTGRLRLPQAATGRLTAHVLAYKDTLSVHDFSVAQTYTVEMLAEHNPIGENNIVQKNILTIDELVIGLKEDIVTAGYNADLWTKERLLGSISNKFKNLKEGAQKRQAAAKDLRLANKKVKVEGGNGVEANGTPAAQPKNQPSGEPASTAAAAEASNSAGAAEHKEGQEACGTGGSTSTRTTRRTRGTKAAAAAGQEPSAAGPKGRKAGAGAADLQTKKGNAAAGGSGSSASAEAPAEPVASLPNLETLLASLVAVAKANPSFAQQVQSAVENRAA